jgi:hypothetical protein
MESFHLLAPSVERCIGRAWSALRGRVSIRAQPGATGLISLGHSICTRTHTFPEQDSAQQVTAGFVSWALAGAEKHTEPVSAVHATSEAQAILATGFRVIIVCSGQQGGKHR